MSGATPFNTQALIYLDGTFIGYAANEAGEAAGLNCFDSQTVEPACDSQWNFLYQDQEKLFIGEHKIMAVAQDRTSLVLSAPSTEIKFLIKEPVVEDFINEPPMPAPTILPPVVNQNTSSTQPFIVGLAKNDSNIKIFIDEKLYGEFAVKNHQSGTANFAFRSTALARGSHQVYAIAMDERGKVSGQSNIINFQVRVSAIAQAVSEDNSQAVAVENNDPGIIKAEPAPVISAITEEAKNVQTENQPAFTERVKNIFKRQDKKAGPMMINESRRNQTGLQLGVLFFVLFFIVLIAWLLWVNRELVRERQKQNQPEKKDSDNNQPNDGQNKLFN